MAQLGASYAHSELRKINDHQVDTALQGDWQDCRQTTKWKTPRHNSQQGPPSPHLTLT